MTGDSRQREWVLPAAIPFASLERQDLEECVFGCWMPWEPRILSGAWLVKPIVEAALARKQGSESAWLARLSLAVAVTAALVSLAGLFIKRA